MLIKYAMMVVCSVLLHLGISEGIKLPGPCPKVPPTSREKGPLSQKLRASIRFSDDTPSHVFNVRCGTWFLIGNSADSPPEALEMTYTDYFIPGTFEDNGNESYILRTSVRDKILRKLLCSETMVEEVRLWQDGDMSFLWSCVNSKNGLEHDAALLVTNVAEVAEETVLKACRKFVSVEMVEHLTFNVTINNEAPFHCPGRQKIQYIFVGTVSVLLIVGVTYAVYSIFSVDYNKVYAISK